MMEFVELFLGFKTTQIHLVVKLGVLAFCVLLFALTFTAYVNTRSRKIAFASAAFGVFAIQQFFTYIDEYMFNIIRDDIRYAFSSAMLLLILILFFLAIVKKDYKKESVKQ